MLFNTNDELRVKLTDKGRAVLLADNALLNATSGRSLPYRLPDEDANGWSTWQMWELMAAFGQHVGNGFDTLFDTGIELVSSALDEAHAEIKRLVVVNDALHANERRLIDRLVPLLSPAAGDADSASIQRSIAETTVVMKRHFSGSEIVELLRKEIAPDKINKLLNGLEVGVNIGLLSNLVNTAVSETASADVPPKSAPIDAGAVRSAVYEDIEMTCATLRERIGEPAVIGDERAEGAHNTLNSLMAVIRARRAQHSARFSMGVAEYNLRRALHKIGQRIEGDEMDEEEQVRLGQEIMAATGVCGSCGGDGREGDEDGVYTCGACNGAGIIVPVEQFNPESHD